MTESTLALPDERPGRDYLPGAKASLASSSQSLLISSNLRAALEYEECLREASRDSRSTLTGSEWGGGLPPPPRPKSGPKMASPQSTRTSPMGSISTPNPLSSSRALDGNVPPSGSAGLSPNPFINPVPRLSHLLREEQPSIYGGDRPADARSIGQGSSDSHATTSSRTTDDTKGSPATSSPSPISGKSEAFRHLRGLSSLQKVEKMIGKSRNALGMIAEGKLTSRRASDADVGVDGSGSGSTERTTRAEGGVMRQQRRVLDRGKVTGAVGASSAPSSPINGYSHRDPTRVAHHPASAGPARSHACPASDMFQPVQLTPSPITDATLHSSSIAIALEHSPSVSSIISSSSPSSTVSSPRSPPSRSASMNDDRESFIELVSPTFSPTESQGHRPFAAQQSSPHDSRPDPRILSQCCASSDDFTFSTFSSTKPLLAPLTTSSGKPPLPTTAKPDFSSRRSRSTQRPDVEQDGMSVSSPSEPSPDGERGLRDRPSTSNLLHPQERSELVRKTRKLTQLFGQTPGVGHPPVDVDLANGRAHKALGGGGGVPSSRTRRKHKPAASMLDDPIVPLYDARKRPVLPQPDGAQYASIDSRRRSLPYSPQDLSSMGVLAVSRDAGHVTGMEGAPNGRWDSHADAEASGSPKSFIDLSDEEGPPGGFPEACSPQTPKGPSASTRRPDSLSLFPPSTPSLLLDSPGLSAEQRAEDERRRKREKLAKLHRFLGSRVPAHLVLGPLDQGVPLPPPAPLPPSSIRANMLPPSDDAEALRIRLRRRRSSSAAEFARTWSDDADRLKEDLNAPEKAINVRRAVKMEKMFGVAPPQVLYHTRQVVSSPGGVSPVAPRPRRELPLLPSPAAGPSSGHNINQTAYKGKSKRNTGRPSTAESTEPLLGGRVDDDSWDDYAGPLLPAASSVYLHYRHSLNSLNDIIDRDDKQSLAELHDYLSGRAPDPAEDTPTEEYVIVPVPALQTTSRAERRRSLPTRTSMASVSSELAFLPSPPPEESSFQQRRRRAAKLTQFFGVNYRELMNEILDSIEKGLEEERGRGTLKPDEVQELLQKLRKLKTKRNNWP